MQRLIAGALLVALLLSGACGRRAARAPKATPTALAQRPLPDWAPKHPSPEFLRAAKVLKPLPLEAAQEVVGDSPEGKMVAARATRTFPAAYEFLGTMTDAQVGRLRSTGELRLPMRSLTAKQRAALEAWFDAWRRAFKGAGTQLEDYRVILYKTGARQDLSNVDAGFKTMGQRVAHLMFWVRKPDGSVVPLDFVFAEM